MRVAPAEDILACEFGKLLGVGKVFEEELTKAFESGFSLGGSSSLDLGGADKVAELH